MLAFLYFCFFFLIFTLGRSDNICDYCDVAYDGCNYCSCQENGDLVCTEIACKLDQLHELECTTYKNATSENKMCSNNCLSYFDGCNYCTCTDSQPICTLMYCADPQSPKCLKYSCPQDCYIYSPDGCNQCLCNDENVSDQCSTNDCDAGSSYCEFSYQGYGVGGTCPENCHIYSPDGCNECYCNDSFVTFACTTRNCFAPADPYCKEQRNPNEGINCPSNCAVYSPDGCNKCKCGENGKTESCTTNQCFVQADPYCAEEIAQNKCPHNCATYFDGCNDCKCDENGNIQACTRKYCLTKQTPYCKKKNKNPQSIIKKITKFLENLDL